MFYNLWPIVAAGGVTSMSMARCSLAAGLLMPLLACSGEPGKPASAVATAPLYAETPPDTASDDGQWRMAGRDYANTRFSGLAQIRADNVSRLRVAWT